MDAEKHNRLVRIMNHMGEEDKAELYKATQELMDRTLEFKHGHCHEADVDIAARIYTQLVETKLAKIERELDAETRNDNQTQQV